MDRFTLIVVCWVLGNFKLEGFPPKPFGLYYYYYTVGWNTDSTVGVH